MADCPSCGSILKYDIPSRKVICTSCSNAYLPEEVDTTQMAEESHLMGVNEFLCPNCGGEIFSTDRDITGVCSYCGSQVVFETRLVQKQRPDLIIPFEKTKQDCKDIYLQHMKHKHFLPKEWKDPAYIDGFRGIYMPYWISDLTQEGNIRYYAAGSKTKHGYVITDTFRVKGELQCEYKGLYHDAGSGFSDDISEKLEPYYVTKEDDRHTSSLKTFYPSYLSGFYSEPSDVEFEAYADYFMDITDRQTDQYLQNHEILTGAKAKPADLEQYQRLDLLTPDSDYISKSTQVINAKGKISDKKLLKELHKLNKAQDEQLEKDLKNQLKEEKADGAPAGNKDTVTVGEKYGYQTRQESKLAMFPVWFMSWKRGERVAYLTVNGQTGRVVADLPIDLKQFFKVFAVWFAICFVVCSLFTIRSYAMPVYAVWFAAITLHMTDAELQVLLEHSQAEIVHKKRNTRMSSSTIGIIGVACIVLFMAGSVVIQNFFNDLNFLGSHISLCILVSLGMLYTLLMTLFCLKEWLKLKGKEKTAPAFLLSTASAVLGTFLVYSGTPSDKLMYAGACAVFACVMVNMLSIILQFNKVATRPLPQFEHQGGDDRA